MSMFPKIEPSYDRNATPREFALEAKIRELTAELHLYRLRDTRNSMPMVTNESAFEPPTFDIGRERVVFHRLVDWTIDRPSPHGGLHMVGRYGQSKDGERGGVAYMVSEPELYLTEDKIQLLGALHEKALFELAKLLKSHLAVR